VKRADLALHAAKADRNAWRIFEPEMERRLADRRDMEAELRGALVRGEIDIHYQPHVRSSDMRLVGFEALLRWHHPRLGDVPPSTFIPIAERIGTIQEIGLWALREACGHAALWPDDLRLNVHMSAVQLSSADLPSMIARALAETGLSARRLEIEVTESVMLPDRAPTLSVLRIIKGFGVSVALDDFGSGHTQLRYLMRFPFDKLKIARAFVAEAGERGTALAILRSFTNLARQLGVVITAEGVETQDQLEIMREAGCDEVQGFLLGSPCPAAELGPLLAAAAASRNMAAA
jgi:EAL domain-containing protein (putative c-di-GMP-specific phosphodiesterase class I)